jgi:ABC-type multidrug transport system fused ATPase/permease subunit
MASAAETAPLAKPAAAPKHAPLLPWSLREVVLFSWMVPIVRRGYRSPLQYCDIPPPPAHLQTAAARAAAVEWWFEQEHPTALKMAWHCHRREVVLGLIASVAYGMTNVVVRPLLLKLTIESVARGSDGAGYSLMLIFIIGATMLFEGIVGASSRHFLCDRLCTGIFGKMGTLIQRKSVHMEGSTSPATQPSTLLGSDLVRVFESSRMLALCPMAVSGIVGGFVLLVLTLGWAGMIGISVLVVMTAGNFVVGKKIKRVEHLEMEAADKRLGIIRQVINDIKPIKLCSWEESFMETIVEARTEECKHMVKFRILYQGVTQVARAMPFIAACPTFVYMAATSQQLVAADIFAALAVFMSLRFGLIMLPTSIALYAASMVSLRRCEEFLALPEHEPLPTPPPCEPDTLARVSGTFEWSGTQFSLQELSLSVGRGELVGVTGSIGSGKTSLLCALLGEMSAKGGKQSDETCLVSSVCFVSQRPFLMSGSVAENICFGAAFDKSKLDAACEMAAMGADLERLPSGIETLVGERGVTLSGGQQQRLALARAFYQEPLLIIADDPLAAVDAAVGKTLFESLQAFAAASAAGEDAQRSVVLAMNQPHLLPGCSRVVHLENGRVVAQGSYDEVVAASPSFAKMTSSSPKANGHSAEFEATTSDAVDTEEVELEAVSESATPDTAAMVEDGTATGDEDMAKKVKVESEKRTTGSVQNDVLATYFAAFGHTLAGVCVFVAAATWTVAGFNDRWLAAWIEAAETDNPDTASYISVYIVGTFIFLVLLVLGSTLFQMGGARAAKNIHNDCAAALLRAPVSYFEKTPSGRFTSRFSADVANTDTMLAQFGDNGLQFVMTILCIYTIVIIILPAMAPFAVIVTIVAGFQIEAVDRSNREIKRMANADMAPVLTDAAETIDGRTVLRHCCAGDTAAGSTSSDGLAIAFFADRFDRDLDTFLRSNFASSALTNWAQLVSYYISFVFSVACACLIIVQADADDKSTSALALNYSFNLPYFLMFFGFIVNNIKVALTALERLLELLDVPQEPPWHTPFDAGETGASWPRQGSIELRDVSLRYSKSLPLAVRSVSATIAAGERIGLCGRTGAGKSSLVVLLFRLVEASGGSVLIDGVDIQKVGLQKLRRCMAVIPQQPLLMDGSLRYNLDPFGKHTDEELNEILSLLGLPDGVTLETAIGGGARGSSGLSAGQRQLLNVGRTLLRKCPVVVMDEPTSNIDAETDSRIQASLIRGKLGARTTVLTIAHRLNTIADYDRIFVMEAGQLVEVGPPAELLAKEGGYFRNMAAEMGEDELRSLQARVEGVAAVVATAVVA